MALAAARLFAVNGTRLEGRARLGSELVARATRRSERPRALRSASRSSSSVLAGQAAGRAAASCLPRLLRDLRRSRVVQWLYFVAIENLPVGVALLDRVHGPALRRALGALRLDAEVRPRVWVAVGVCTRRPRTRRRSSGSAGAHTVGVIAALGGGDRAARVPARWPSASVEHRDPRRPLLRAPLRVRSCGRSCSRGGSSRRSELDRERLAAGKPRAPSAPVWALVLFIDRGRARS